MGPARTVGVLEDPDWKFAPHEQSPIPGSPANPDHSASLRTLYGIIGLVIGITGGLGNALIAVNLTQLQGGLGLYSNEIAWLPAVYAMTNVTSSFVLIKYRQQFGLRSFTIIFLGLYCLLTACHLLVHGFASALMVRAASGIAGSALTSLGLYYVAQSFSAEWRLKGIVVGISVPQLAIPIARLFSTDLLAIDQWRALYLFELGLSLLSLAGVILVRLPPTVRSKAFEWLDLPTIVLFACGTSLICCVLGLGRYDWWTDTPWIGLSLASAIPLLAAVCVIEYHRANPLIDLRWLASLDLLRFLVVGVVARIVLSEQSYGSIGLLNSLGYTNDELRMFSLLLVLASAAGIAASAWIIRPERLTQPVMYAVGLVAVGAWMDTSSTNLTRAPELYFSQMLIAFSTTLFVGPALLIGFVKVVASGGRTLTTYILLFGITQTVGSLVGTAVLGTYQVDREKAHSSELVQRITLSDPIVTSRLAGNGSAVEGVLGDPALRSAEAAAMLGQQVRTEANVLAYNDVFRLIALLASATTLMLALLHGQRWWVARRTA